MLGQILELRRAAVSFERIGMQLGMDADAARAAYAEALDETDPRFDVRLEIERIDRLHTVAWRKASSGDLNAMDRVLRLSERRERLLAAPREQKHEMRDAFDESAAAAAGVDRHLDASILASGRAIADRIDAALCSDDATETTKALYMVPHLVNILRELGATPKARLDEVAQTAGAAAAARPNAGQAVVRPVSNTFQRRQRAAQRGAAS